MKYSYIIKISPLDVTAVFVSALSDIDPDMSREILNWPKEKIRNLGKELSERLLDECDLGEAEIVTLTKKQPGTEN